MKPELYQRVFINRDIPDENLKQGDLGWLIDYVPHPSHGEEGAILEVFNILGESIGVIVVPISTIEPVNANQIPSVRTIEETLR